MFTSQEDATKAARVTRPSHDHAAGSSHASCHHAQSPHEFSPMASYPGAKTIPPSDHSFEGSLARLHEIAWGKRDINVLFHDHVVHRDGTCTQPYVVPPHTVRALRWGKANPGVLRYFGISSLFFRNEYHGILKDILQIAGEAAGGGGEFPIPDLPHDGSLHGAIVCGSPGIGKTTFLTFVLAICILFGLPTVLQLSVGQFFVVNPDGVFAAKLEENVILGDHIPDYTWLLVDSNHSVKTVTDEYIRLSHSVRCCILQAASPRAGRLEWMKKVTGRVPIFWMAPWSPAELIAARNLQGWRQEDTVPSEAQLLVFAQKYGTSARHAYNHAKAPDEYENILVGRSVSTLDSETIRTMLKNAEGIEMDSEISHLLLEVYPAPGDRRRFSLDIPTDHLVDKIVERLEAADQQASLHLYWLFLTNSHTRSAAGHLLEKASKTQFKRGGEWPITKMKRQAANDIIRWRLDDSAAKQYLRVGYGRTSSKIFNRPLRNPQDAIKALEDTPYARGASFTLTTGCFYRPVPMNLPSYDGFVYDSKGKHATVFQVTIAKDHQIVHEGLNWLRGLGALSIDLVVVTCPRDVDPEFFGAETIWTSNDGVRRINNVYHLPLHVE